MLFLKRTVNQKITFLSTLIIAGLCNSIVVHADNLSERNIPNARLAYEDESGRYYAALMGHRHIHPSDTIESEVTLRIYAERILAADGSYFEASPSKALSYPEADPSDGLIISEREITRLGKKVIPAAIKLFPEWQSHPNWTFEKDAMMVNFYIDGVFLYGKGGWGEKVKNASNKAEQPAIGLSFKRRSTDGIWRPAYEADGLLGHSRPVSYRLVSTILSQREQLPRRISNERTTTLAAFSRHKAYLSKLWKERLATYIDRIESERKSGFVYKSGRYWGSYDGFDTPRKVTEGQFQFIEHPGDFAQAYLTFIDQYYEHCESYLPGNRYFYDKKVFEAEFGFTPELTKHYYVEMEPRFADQYKAMMKVRYRRELGLSVTSIIHSFAGVEGKTPFSFFGDFLELAATAIVEEKEMGRFLLAEGCRSAIVRQYADNLWRGAQGLESIQATNTRYSGAQLATMPFERADGIWHRDQSLAALARSPSREHAHPYFDEEVVAYRTGMGLINDGRNQVAAMKPMGQKLQERGYPVLYCFYGPTGYLKNGNFNTLDVAFWYEEKPVELPSLLDARSEPSDVYPGLEHARTRCPETSGEALAIIKR